MRVRKVSLGTWITVFGVLAIAVATMTPSAGRGSDGPPWCMSCPLFTERAGVDLVLNVLLYVPIGVGLALLRRGPGHVAAIAAVISAVIETLQVSVIPGRFASLADVITNTSGALLGLAAARHWRAIVEPSPVRSRLFAAVASVIALAVLHLTMWAQQEIPPPRTMATLWRPAPSADADGAASETGRGSRITYVTVAGRPHTGRVRLTPNEIARMSGREGYALQLGLIAAALPGDEDPAFELRDGDGRRILRVRQDGRHLAADVATRARALRLRTPSVRLRRFLPSRADRAERSGLDTVHIAVRAANGSLWLNARQRTSEARGEHRRGAFAGWSLLISQSNSPARVRILTFAWVFFLMLAPVYWAVLGLPSPRVRTPTRTNGRRVWRLGSAALGLAAFLVVILALALEMLPRANGMEPAGITEGLAVAAAIASGGFLAFRTARRTRGAAAPA